MTSTGRYCYCVILKGRRALIVDAIDLKLKSRKNMTGQLDVIFLNDVFTDVDQSRAAREWAIG